MKIAFTIATSNYLAQAKTLADSFLLHNPDYTFSIVLLDKIHGIDSTFFDGIQLIEIEKLDLPYLREMIDRYTIFELSNSLKPFCADYFLHYGDEVDAVLYFDSDMAVYDTLSKVNDLLSEYSIILTPHVLHPPPFDGLSIGENNFLSGGIYNAGFFAITKSTEAGYFLTWWKERMRTHCLVDLAHGYFVDQIWLNLVPLYFKHVKILDDPGYNMAFWNLHERIVTQTGNEKLFVNHDEPLVFFHFSGFDVHMPGTISKYQNRFFMENRPDLIPLYRDYSQAVLNNGYDQFSRLNCYYYIEKEGIKQNPVDESHVLEFNNIARNSERFLSLFPKILSRCKRSFRILVKGV